MIISRKQLEDDLYPSLSWAFFRLKCRSCGTLIPHPRNTSCSEVNLFAPFREYVQEFKDLLEPL